MSSYNQPEDVRQADPKMPWNAPDPVGAYDCCKTDMFMGEPCWNDPEGVRVICVVCMGKEMKSEVERIFRSNEKAVRELASALGFTAFTAEPPEPPEDPNRP